MTPGSIIDALGGTGQVAAALAVKDSTVSSWRTRSGGIPAPHWASLVRLAEDLGRNEVTLEALADFAARRPAEART